MPLRPFSRPSLRRPGSPAPEPATTPARAAPPESAPPAPQPEGERLRRPLPARTGPDRSPGGLFRGESPAPRGPALAPSTPAEEGVALAYQVFDRYLEEGRRFAAGQSAWYPTDEAGGPRDLLGQALRNGTDLLALLSRAGRDVSRLTDAALRVLPGRGADARPAGGDFPFHPQAHPGYPQYPRSTPARGSMPFAPRVADAPRSVMASDRTRDASAPHDGWSAWPGGATHADVSAASPTGPDGAVHEAPPPPVEVAVGDDAARSRRPPFLAGADLGAHRFAPSADST